MSKSGAEYHRSHDRLQSQARARRFTHELRLTREEYDFAEELEDVEPDWESAERIAEEDADPNHFFRGDSQRPIDFTWQSSSPRIEDYLLVRRPKVRWRVELTQEDSIRVVGLCASHRSVTPSDPSPFDYRREILTVAALEQLPYLRSGRIEDLKVLSTGGLVEAGLAHGNDQTIWQNLEQRRTSLGNWLARQFFYDPRGRLHAMSFLLQEDIGGLPYTRVYMALSQLLAEERAEGVFAPDKDLVCKLKDRLPGLQMTVKDMRRLRERFWFPKKSERRRLYGARS